MCAAHMAGWTTALMLLQLAFFPLILPKVRFDSIGGLSHHIHALKEMVVFPLLYPEIFEKFKIQPPRYVKPLVLLVALFPVQGAGL